MLVVLITSCGCTKSSGISKDFLTANTWQLKSLNGDSSVSYQFPNGLPYITFTGENKLNGKGGCNSYGGSYELGDDGEISMGEIMSTKMYCDGVGENDFFDALNKANKVKKDNKDLVLMADTDEIMVFSPKAE